MCGVLVINREAVAYVKWLSGVPNQSSETSINIRGDGAFLFIRGWKMKEPLVEMLFGQGVVGKASVEWHVSGTCLNETTIQMCWREETLLNKKCGRCAHE